MGDKRPYKLRKSGAGRKPLKPTKKMRLKMTLKPMQPINSEACVVILLLQEHVNGSYWMSICTLLIKAF